MGLLILHVLSKCCFTATFGRSYAEILSSICFFSTNKRPIKEPNINISIKKQELPKYKEGIIKKKKHINLAADQETAVRNLKK